MAENTHAGAGAVQPLPSRKGGLGGESRPLQSFIDAVPLMRAAMHMGGANAFSFSPLNALPKIALEKWDVEVGDTCITVQANGTCRIIPLSTQPDYYHAVLGALDRKVQVTHVPEWIANALKGHYPMAKTSVEYVMRTEDVQAFPGGHNRQMRGNVNKARRLCTVEDFDPANLHEYAALVKTWYKQNQEIKFRTYDKTSIDWLLENWTDLKAAIPDLTCLGIRYEGQLISLNMGCLLSEQTWTAYTQRFDRAAPIKHGNMLGYNELAKRFADTPFENDGTADTPTIKEWKDRLVYTKHVFYTVG